jgi:hypothetical protein
MCIFSILGLCWNQKNITFGSVIPRIMAIYHYMIYALWTGKVNCNSNLLCYLILMFNYWWKISCDFASEHVLSYFATGTVLSCKQVIFAVQAILESSQGKGACIGYSNYVMFAHKAGYVSCLIISDGLAPVQLQLTFVFSLRLLVLLQVARNGGSAIF